MLQWFTCRLLLPGYIVDQKVDWHDFLIVTGLGFRV